MGERPIRSSIISKVKDNFILKILLCVVLCSLVIIVFLIMNKILDVRISRVYTIVDDIRFMNSIEKVTTERDEIKLYGYAFILERDSSDDIISVFLRNVVTEKEVWFDMEQVDKPDVSAYFEGEFDYKKTGFVASTDSKALDVNECYEIIININYVKTDEDSSKDVRRTVSTNRYIINGELYTYNPVEFDKPDIDIESKLLREVFLNGQLCLYQKEEGMYVYKYEEKLYWVVKEDFNLEESREIYIIYQPYTSQTEKLPEHRIQYRYDNLDFSFADHEYRDEISEPYRVAIRDIPDEYPITYLRTGVYDTVNKKTLWHEQFQIDHNFN